jgi:TonB-dependent receptor
MKKHQMKLGLLAAAVIAAISGNAMAQEAQNEKSKKEKQAEEIEVIEVTGIASGLKKSLLIKRHSDLVVDAISADDLGQLPAMDFGEALQVIPGVQLNRENDDGNRRKSEISLRGLPGNYTLVTANGQSFASPSLSVIPSNGEPSAFGAFESSVFDGVTVYKSQRADLIEGGIAGVVDKQLAKALSKPDGDLFVTTELQFEELSDSTNPKVTLGGSKHLIKDVLAGTFRFAHSKQDFRRDILNITRYNAIQSRFDGLDDWKAENGIGAEDNVVYPSDIRQYSEISEGERTSFTGGLEYQPTDALKLGVDVLYTERDMPNSTLEMAMLVTRGGRTKITPTGSPFLGFTDPENGEKTYVIDQYDYDNTILNEINRTHASYEQARGMFFDAEYLTGQWTITGALSISDATSNRTGSNVFLGTEEGKLEGGNGFNGHLSSGRDSIDDFEWTLNARDGFGGLDSGYTLSSTPYNDNYASGADGSRFYFAGNEIWRDRTEQSVKLDVAYELDEGWIESVQVGARYSENTVDANLFHYGMGGMHVENISSDFFTEPNYVGTTNFFGGEAPGFLPAPTWRSLDLDKVYDALLGDNGADNPGGLHTGDDGIIYRTESDQVTPLGLTSSNDAEIGVTALYAMADFYGELGDIPVYGNFGVRYVNTDISAVGYSKIDGQYTQETANSDYDNLLPSINVNVGLREDVIFRLGYSETLTRPNLAGFTPGRSVTESIHEVHGGTKYTVVMPSSELEAYTSENLDASLEWYNRDGGAITLAIYQKKVSNYFELNPICPADGGGLGYGNLELRDNEGEMQCYSTTPNPNAQPTEEYPDGVPTRVNITETVNIDQDITIRGLEVGIQQNLDFLDGFWGGFGSMVNASFLDVSGKDEDGLDLTIPRISDKSFNVVGYWENDEFVARLAYNWRSEYFLVGSNSFTGYQDRQVKARGQLDFVTNYKFTKQFSMAFKAYNLTNSLYEEFQSDNPDMTRLRAYDGRTYAISASYRF